MIETQLPIRDHLRITGFLLAVWCAWITVWSLVPFQLVDSWAQVISNLRELLTLFSRQPILRSVVEHVGLALPMGWWGYVWLKKYRKGNVGRACLLGSIVFLTLLEIAQCFFQRRHASLLDLLLSAAGIGVGIGVARWMQRLKPIYDRWLTRYRSTIYTWIAVLGSATMCYVSVIAHTRVNIQHWDIRFPLLVGNELSGNRPWLGCIKGLAIYDRALTLLEAATLVDTSFHRELSNDRISLGAEAIYDFTVEPSGQAIRQIVPSDPPLDLLLPESKEPTLHYRDGALEIVKPTLIRTKSFSKRLAIAATMTNELSVEVLVRAASNEQDGPARIVSMSHGVNLANFMVGQYHNRFDFRIRTPRTGNHGAQRICRSAKLDLTDGWHHVVATYKDGVQNIYIDGKSARRPLYLYAISQVVLATDWPGASVLAALLCFIPIGFAVGAGCHGKVKLMAVLMLVAVTPLIVLAYCAKIYEHEYDVVFTIASILSAIGGLVWAKYLTRKYVGDDQVTSNDNN